MKGLILKDLYMMRAYCRSYMLITAVFLLVSFVGKNMVFIYYPCLLCGMIPINLLAYDERSNFMQYSISLPVSRVQTVSGKYLVGLFSQITVLFITGIVQGIKMNINGTFVLGEFVIIIVSVFLVSILASAIPLPLIFKYGVEKGRIAYYVMIGIVCGAAVLFSYSFKDSMQYCIQTELIFYLLLGLGVYALSWYLSVVFYKKREL